MTQLYFLEIGQGDDCSAAQEMLMSLPAEKREKLLRYRFGIDRKIGVLADVVLRCLLAREAGLAFGDVVIRADGSGKPYLEGRWECMFSLSHTRSAVAVAVSDGPVGVDVEKVRKADAAVAKAALSAGELLLLGSSRAEDRDRVFCELWTRKEAFLKYTGQGLAGDLKAVDTAAPVRGTVLSTLVSGGYVMSVCAREAVGESGLLLLSEAEVAEMWREAASRK